MISHNPFDGCSLPKVEPHKRAIRTSDMIRTALDSCTDTKLYPAIFKRFDRQGGREKAPASEWQQALFGTPGATQDA